MRKLVTILLVVLAIGLLWAAGGRNGELARRRPGGPAGAVAGWEQAPPLAVLTTVVFGGFRGLAADLLWLRVSYLQSQSDYFEIVQLADWITRLDPGSGETWGFHAWNMAFNVAAMMAEPEDRWRWVQSGIHLLRDEGLRLNPGDAALHDYLSWIYILKIGSDTDSAAGFYRRQLAGEMTALLDGARPDYDRLARLPVRRPLEAVQLIPELMQELERQYGPLDWRLPETHALYWAWRGRREGRGPLDPNSARLIYQSAAAGLFHGRSDFRPAEGVYRTGPNPALLPGALRAYEEALAAYPNESFRTAYVNFLHRAVRLFGRLDDATARRLFGMLSTRFPSDLTAAGYDAFVDRMQSDP